jgi:hypothetical protein
MCLLRQEEGIHTGRPRVFGSHAHLVLLARYRRPVFTAACLARMKAVMGVVRKDLDWRGGRVQRRDQYVRSSAPPGRIVPARQLPEGRVLTQAAAEVSRAGPVRLAGEAVVVWVELVGRSAVHPWTCFAYIAGSTDPQHATHFRPEGPN